MQYMLLIYEDEKRNHTLSPEEGERIMGAYMAYTNALHAAGALLRGDALHPTSAATTVRGTGVIDGPYTETKEQLGGYYLVDLPDLNAALEWAKRCPAAQNGGSVEVRPVMVFTPEQLASAQPNT
ncbi:MAG: YciI family protein [Acidobacteriaceae bacterium]|nr:YciI family protein [Acidobacteriaceae bacterium]